jgi:hypothetical protein
VQVAESEWLTRAGNASPLAPAVTAAAIDHGGAGASYDPGGQESIPEDVGSPELGERQRQPQQHHAAAPPQAPAPHLETVAGGGGSGPVAAAAASQSDGGPTQTRDHSSGAASPIDGGRAAANTSGDTAHQPGSPERQQAAVTLAAKDNDHPVPVPEPEPEPEPGQHHPHWHRTLSESPYRQALAAGLSHRSAQVVSDATLNRWRGGGGGGGGGHGHSPGGASPERRQRRPVKRRATALSRKHLPPMHAVGEQEEDDGATSLRDLTQRREKPWRHGMVTPGVISSASPAAVAGPGHTPSPSGSDGLLHTRRSGLTAASPIRGGLAGGVQWHLAGGGGRGGGGGAQPTSSPSQVRRQARAALSQLQPPPQKSPPKPLPAARPMRCSNKMVARMLSGATATHNPLDFRITWCAINDVCVC